MRNIVTAVLSLGALALCASAQPHPPGGQHGPMKNVFCPPSLMVKFVPANPFALQSLGWQANTGAFPVQLDPANPPRVSGGNMVCYYKLLNQPGAFNIYQPLNSHNCSPLSNGTGFVCTL